MNFFYNVLNYNLSFFCGIKDKIIMAHLEDQCMHILTARYEALDVLFPTDGICELDMGCGSGSFTTALAQRYPERHVFASDIMIGRLRKLQKRVIRLGLEQFYCLRIDSRHLLGYGVPDAVIDRLHLLCPDPWPKDKHRANRLICSDFVARIHRVLKRDGIFHFSSDDTDYFHQVVKVINDSNLFAQADAAIDDIKDIKSDFEKRWLSLNKSVEHMAWRKKPLIKNEIGH